MIDHNAERLREWHARGFANEAERKAFNTEVDLHNANVTLDLFFVISPLVGFLVFMLINALS